MLREDGKDQSSNGGNGIVTQEPFENGSPMLEVCVGGNGSDGARADNGIRIAQGSVDETAADCSSAAGEQLVHHPADRCREPRSTRKSVLPTIRKQDGPERTLNLNVVAPTLSDYAHNERQRIEYRVSIVVSQAAEQEFTSPRRYGFDPVVCAKREEWDFLTTSTLSQHLECRRPDEAVCV